MTEMDDNHSLSVDRASDGMLVVHGDIDVAGGPILEQALREREGTSLLIVDLADVYFIDSSGLRCLLGASRRASEHGGQVVLRGVGPEVLRLLEITGTTDQFTIDGRRG